MCLGLSTALWAVVDAALLRPLPYPDAKQLVAIMEQHPRRGVMAVTPANFLDWAASVPDFRNAAVVSTIEMSVGAPQQSPSQVSVMKVSTQFFQAVGTQPALGRTPSPPEIARGDRLTVIAHRLWLSQLNRRADILGSSLRIDGEPFTIVGVMPSGFRLFDDPDVWVPLVMSPEEWRERRFHTLVAIARLAPGRTASSAERALSSIYARLEQEHPNTNLQWRAQVSPFRTLMLGDSTQSLAALTAAIAIVVVIGCSNVTSLLLAWLPGRRREFLVRMAVGATTTRVVRQLLVEVLLWSAIGVTLGTIGAASLISLFARLVLPTTWHYDFDPRLDVRVIAGMAFLLLIIVAATAVAPTLVIVRRSRDLIPKRHNSRSLMPRVAWVAQVALCVVLVAVGAALLTAFRQMSALSTSLGADRALAIPVELPLTRYRDDPSMSRFFEQLITGVSGRHEVRAVGAASYVPPEQPRGNVRFTIEGRATDSDALTAIASAVDPMAFRMLRIPLRRGRLLEDRDTAQAPRIAVISDALARRYWPNEDPIGRRVTVVGVDAPVSIVGIVGDVHQPLSKDPRAESILYLSYLQVPWSNMTLIVEPSAESSAAVTAVREQIQTIDPTVAAGTIRPVADVRSAWLAQPRLQASIVSIFGVASVTLTLIGLFSRVMHSVTVRTREFAIRQAVGATSTAVVLALSGQVFWISLVGAVGGLAVLPPISRFLRHWFVEFAGISVQVAVLTALLITALSTACAYLPARRVYRINPAAALKQE
jgi:putative ABC transport system permease protein